MTNHIRGLRATLRLGACGIALAATIAPASAFAQAAPAEEAQVVVVTGSRIATQQNRAISPVRITDNESIQATGLVDIDEVLKQSNEFLPSNGAGTSPALLESHGASTIDMRGLGQNRTLVLVNGQRATPNGFRNSADVNTIPSAMIARVESLTGGAAAVYGADAVAGVTNFILRDTYEGLEVTATGSTTERGGAESWSVGVTGGRSFFDDRLNIVGHVGFTDRGGLSREERDWAQPEVNDAGLLLQTFPTAGGTFTRWGAATTAPAASALPAFAYNADGGLVAGATVPGTTFAKYEAFWNPNDRTNYAVFANFKVTDWANFYFRGTHSVINNTSQQVPIRSNGNPAAQDVLIQRTNPFISSSPALAAIFNAPGFFNLNAAGTGPGTDAVRLRVAKTLLEFGPLTDETERTMTQFVVGVKGEITENIRYDLAYVTGKNIEVVNRIGSGQLDRYLQAVNGCVGVVAAGCTPLNLFGPNAASAAAVAFVANGDDVELFNKRSRHQDVLNLNISGDTTGLFELPAGPIGWAIGAERREEFGNSLFGARAATRNHLHTQGARGNLVADFALTEYFGELRIPVLKDVPFARALDLEAAGRRSQHSRSGDYDTWKLGLNWAVSDQFRIRGSQQAVVRGPNIGEFFGAAVQAPILGTARPTDYCSDPARYNVPTTLCAALGAPSTPGYVPLVNGVPLIDGAVAVQGGGEAIRPESGDTFTYGFVFTPNFIPGLSVILDYYEIQIDDAIGTINPIQLMDSCYLVLQDATSALCQKIRRDPTTGRVVLFDQRDTNLTLLRTAGWDFSLYYNARLPEELPGERINIAFNAGIVDTFVRLLFPSDNLFDCAGDFGGGACSDSGTGIRAIPEYRHNLNVSWINGPLTIRGAWRMTGSVEALIKKVPEPQWRNVAPNNNLVQKIKAWDYFDLGFSYRINDNMRVGGTIANILDKEPPILGSAQQDANTLPNQYDILGRRFSLNLTWRM
jgi:outer membrane receptor protein involved in Fe transport